MKSVTKTTISETSVFDAVRKHFPSTISVRAEELKGGAFNTAYLVTSEGSPSLRGVMKIGPSQSAKTLTYEKDIMRTEIEVYRMLENADLPLPKVIVADTDRDVLPCDWFLMTELKGTPWNKADKGRIKRSRPALMHELGRITATINNVRGERFGYIKKDRHFLFDKWADAFRCMIRDITKDCISQGKDLPYDAVTDAVLLNIDVLNEVEEPRLVDFDIWAGNVFLKERGDGYVIDGLTDLERAFFGDPYADMAASSLQMLLSFDVTREREYIAGRDSVADSPTRFSRSERIRIALYKMYLSLIMNAETYRYGKVFAKLMHVFSKHMIKKCLAELRTL